MTSVAEDRAFRQKVFLDSIPEGVLGEAIDWIAKNLVPEDVFDEKELSEWATENGFVKNGQTP